MAGKTKSFTLRIKYNAPVTLTFALLALGAFFFNQALGGKPNELFFSTYRHTLLDPLTYVRAFGHVLGHASWDHYFNNMLLFLLLGPILEEKYGSKPLLFMIVITAVVTALVNAFFFPYTHLLGASGIVFMFILLSSVVAVEKGEIPISFIVIVVLYLGKEIVNMMDRNSISELSHIIGGAFGSFFGFYSLGSKKK
ncbi:MAG: rhomboid family intramembrane serine protease [Lachnospiraceae bacterium]|nr:rhomboid family intramembrane serine protease [Lachnospiraceae bacterium]